MASAERTPRYAKRDLSINDAAIAAAKTAHLRYVTDRSHGLRRERNGDRFIYRDAKGVPITDSAELARIGALAIPPAWTDVWICTRQDGHLQATGRDARGRKQYRYHARWRQVRDETKYDHVVEFGRALPAIRRRVEADLAQPGLPRDKILAAIIRLMERTLARVGNPEYARQNDSFGLTTLKNRHVRITRGQIELDFRAKSGVHHHSVVTDKKLARIVRNCKDLPGAELFQYLDENGNRHRIDSADVNQYLRSISGREITAKDFRTWAATNLAVLALHDLNERVPTKSGSLTMVKRVAEQLGNTPAVCRKCYIHPAIFESYLAGSWQFQWARIGRHQTTEIWEIEGQLLAFLKRYSRPDHSHKTLKVTLRASLKAAKSKRRLAAH